ncbi:JmjC domain-containing protein [Alteromonas sp. CYL-A6]|uniref:JmjC domain-containing protein n=1 Tax=Alteromonas nitratireducens TaxID=3390813 RepID=UPI0034BB219A
MSLNPSAFLANYWQQRPMVIRGLFSGDPAPLDEHDLAGLAQEDDIDSRIIRHQGAHWDVLHGPFDDFESACQGQWTLLVQAVDRHIPEAATLFRPFSFLPHWRFDDLMVSFAVAGAGVGPHYDQYDVFLVQGKGRRRWRVGRPGDYPPVTPHPDLCQIEGFDAELEVELAPGDVLYIPPGWPHDGVALEDCLTYSVGFRAPDTAGLSHLLAEHIATSGNSARFADAQRKTTRNPACVTSQERAALKALLHDAIDSSSFDNALMCFLSEQSLPVIPEAQPVDAQWVKQALEAGETFVPQPGCRPLYKDTLSADPVVLYIDGEALTFPLSCRPLVDCLLSGKPITVNIFPAPPPLAICETLSTLINKGYWVPEAYLCAE